jgi:uncharacterized protein (DUF1330 family)
VDARAIDLKRARSQDFKNRCVTVDGGIMAKGYWIVFYRSVSNPAAVAQYAKPAEAAILAVGGRFLARGTPFKVFEAGIKDRSVVIEFDSAAKALEAYQSPAYQSALKLLEGAVERDVRILEGVS